MHDPHFLVKGAGKLAVYLESTYGVDGFAMLVDEGGKLPGSTISISSN